MKRLSMYLLLLASPTLAQQTFYDVTAANGNGVRFWQSDNYKIHMGYGAEYFFGPVTDYSIKMNIAGGSTRGWTWGAPGNVPVAGLSALGHMQIAGNFTAASIVGANYTYVNNSISAGNSWTRSNFGSNVYWDGSNNLWQVNAIGNNDFSAMIHPNADGLAFITGTSIGNFPRSLANNEFMTYERMRISANGNVGIGTSSASNAQGWARVLDVHGSTDAKAIATNDGGQRVGIYSHSSWLGGGGFVGTETNHNLHFLTGYAPKMSLLTNGYLGIGNTSPVAKLQVNSSIERETFRVYKEGNTTNYLSIWQGTGAGAIDPIGTGKLYLGYDQTTDVYFNGKVGIGTTSPNQKLTVNGTIYGKEVKVDLNVPGPDYVFEEDYKLPSLDEIKSYVDQHKHLPEVPSAKEMELNGINLSEMNMILLKKVEELTLMMLKERNEKNSQIKSLQTELEKVKRVINEK